MAFKWRTVYQVGVTAENEEHSSAHAFCPCLLCIAEKRAYCSRGARAKGATLLAVVDRSTVKPTRYNH